MNIEDEITFKHLTVHRLCQIIAGNLDRAAQVNYTMSWGFKGTRLYGQLTDHDGKIVWRKFYTGKLVPALLADMHADVRRVLQCEIDRRKPIPLSRKKGAEDAGMTIGEKVSQFNDRDAERQEMIAQHWKSDK